MKEFSYCFAVHCKDKTLYLTSHSHIIKSGDIKYMPYSGLYMRELLSNDSAKDLVTISGIWEDGGITKHDDIVGTRIEINIIFLDASKKPANFSEYICTKVMSEDLQFHLYLEPISFRLSKTITMHYGKNCRANFGDMRCLADKSLYPEGSSCDKSFITCCNKFNNAVNFRGEPFIPGSFMH